MGLPSSRTAKANGSLKHTHQPNPAPSTPDTENTFDWTTRIKAENEANKAESNSNNNNQKNLKPSKAILLGFSTYGRNWAYVLFGSSPSLSMLNGPRPQ